MTEAYAVTRAAAHSLLLRPAEDSRGGGGVLEFQVSVGFVETVQHH